MYFWATRGIVTVKSDGKHETSGGRTKVTAGTTRVTDAPVQALSSVGSWERSASVYGAEAESTLKSGREAPALRRRAGMLLVIAVVALSVAGCAKLPKAAKPTTDPSGMVIETNEKTGISRIDFTKAAKSAERLGIKTEKVGSLTGIDGQPGPLTVPYASVLYTAQGETLVYTNPEPLVFVRHPITIDHIQEDKAVLSAGPPSGTSVVTLGAAELTGIEFGVGK